MSQKLKLGVNLYSQTLINEISLTRVSGLGFQLALHNLTRF
jgi:hypothetical protein